MFVIFLKNGESNEANLEGEEGEKMTWEELPASHRAPST